VKAAVRATPLWQVPTSPPDLAPGEMQVFAFALDLPSTRVTKLERLLSADEAERAARFRQPRDCRRYVVHRALARLILGASIGERPRQLRFQYSEYGKPMLPPGSGAESVRFNLSRSQEVGMVALQLEVDLGIDVEQVRPFPPALDIAARFFTPEEHARLCSLPVAELDAAFFSYWTRKEAIVKALGLGLSHPLDRFTLAPSPGPEGERALGHSVVSLLPPFAGYVAAVAAAQASRLCCFAWPDHERQ
jgi:4'-phosphopantetheinyl transferase